MDASDTLLSSFRDTTLALVRNDDRDLTSRQMGVFLVVYTEERCHTIRRLAADLNIGRPAITRAADRLEGLGLVRRKPDPADGRSVLLTHTGKGGAFLRELRKIVAAKPARSAPGPKRKSPATAVAEARA